MDGAAITLRELPTTTTPVFVSREPVRSPSAPHLSAALTQFVAMDPNCSGSISVRFGKGFLMTSGRFAGLSEGDYTEVVDYDPVKGIALLIGMQPPTDVPLHWLVYRTFPMAGGAVHVSVDPPPAAITTRLEDRHPKGSFLSALDGVTALRSSPLVRSEGGWIAQGGDLARCLLQFSPAAVRRAGGS